MPVPKSSELCNDGLAKWTGTDALDKLARIRVLIVGAGGLGCEILKNLCMSGFKCIDIIDMDTIELTNLNRQFLFDENSIGQSKAEVAAQKIRNAIQCEITAHFCRIEDMPDSFYQQFNMIVCGLDSVQARRWINAKLVNLCYNDCSPDSTKPLIDGGSEGFRGQARVILPGITACYECTLSLLPSHQETSYALCTIATIPRLPEHCIEWTRLIRWPQMHNNLPDYDNDNDVLWIFNESVRRAALFKINGITLPLVRTVLKRIVPALSTTNAIIAASCGLEALKIATGKCDPINNYFMYSGDHGIYSSVLQLDKREDCPVCGSMTETIEVERKQTLQRLLEYIRRKYHLQSCRLPSISTASGKLLYMPKFEETRANLSRDVSSLLLPGGEELALSHPELAFALRVYVNIV